MPKRTLMQKYIAGLVAKGEHVVKNTPRYAVFTRNAGGYYYVGTAGAVRAGPTRANSRPCSTAFKQQLINLGEGK